MAVDGGDLSELTGITMNDLDLDDVPSVYLDDDEAVHNSDPNMQGSTEQGSAASGGSMEVCGANDVEDSSDTENDSTLPQQYEKEMKSRKSKTLKQERVKEPWSAAEKCALLEHFCSNIKARKVPGKEECDNAIEKFPILSKKRSWKVIYSQKHNHKAEETRCLSYSFGI